MALGMHLHELWRTRWGLVVSLLIASVISVMSSSQSPSMAAASTHVLVDNPNAVLLDLGQGSQQFAQMTNRALLLGNIMSTLPVLEYIGARAGVPGQAIQVTTPTTPQYPSPISDPNHQRKTTDLLRSNNEYRINVQANPTVPILDVYTEASTVAKADALANAAVNGLGDYLAAIGKSQGVQPSQQVRLDQLGSAQGGSVTGGGIGLEVMILTFLGVFALSAAASVFVARVIRGWRLTGESESETTARPPLNGALPARDREVSTA